MRSASGETDSAPDRLVAEEVGAGLNTTMRERRSCSLGVAAARAGTVVVLGLLGVCRAQEARYVAVEVVDSNGAAVRSPRVVMSVTANGKVVNATRCSGSQAGTYLPLGTDASVEAWIPASQQQAQGASTQAPTASVQVPREAKSITLSLRVGMVVDGVVKLPDGSPASGVRVGAWPTRWIGMGVRGERSAENLERIVRYQAEGSSGRRGEFKLMGLANEEYFIAPIGDAGLWRDGPRGASTAFVGPNPMARARPGEAPLTLVLRPAAESTVTLRADASDDAAGTRMSFRSPLEAPMPSASLGDSHGSILVSGVDSAATYLVDYLPASGTLRRLMGVPWSSSVNAVHLLPSYELRGVVSGPDGQPVAGLTLSIAGVPGSGAFTETDSRGRFRYSGLSSDEVLLVAHRDEVGKPQPDSGWLVHAGSEEVALALDPNKRMAVEVVGERTPPIRGVLLAVPEGTNAPRVAAAVTESPGRRAVFESVPPAESYTVWIPPDSRNVSGLVRGVRSGKEPARVMPGPGRNVTGRVHLPADVLTYSVWAEAVGLPVRVSATDLLPDGTFGLSGLTDSEWRVFAEWTCSGGAFRTAATLVRGATTLDIAAR